MILRRAWIGVLGVFLSLSSTGMAQADGASEWKHLLLRSEQGVEIQVDYQVVRWSDYSSYGYTAQPVWINVRKNAVRQALDSSDHVRVVVNSLRDFESDCPQATKTLDLSYAGDGRFTGQIPNGLVLFVGNPSTNTNYQNLLSVVVSGVWQKDPVTRDNSFNLLLN